jgi:acetyltransferase-like isoleucine patch superfamily enzyme
MRLRTSPSGPELIGTANGQTLVWNATTQQWVPGAGQFVHDVVFNVPLVAAGSAVTITLTVPDVAIGDSVVVNPDVALSDAIAITQFHENGTGQVDVVLVNYTVGNVTPGNTTFRVAIMKP